MKCIRSALAATVMLTPFHVQADTADHGFYVGGGVGMSNIDIEGGTGSRSRLELLCDAESCGESDRSDRLTVGYQLHRALGVEASYQTLGEAEEKALLSNTPETTLLSKLETRAATVALVGRAPIKGNLDFFGRLGLEHRTLELQEYVVITGGRTTYDAEKAQKTQAVGGIGLAWQWQALELRMSHEVRGGDDAFGVSTDVNTSMVDALWHF